MGHDRFHDDGDAVTSAADRPDLGGMDDEHPGLGWWVGSDGAWHAPEEDFHRDVPRRNHPVRRVFVVVLAVALVGATTVGAWLGITSPTTTTPDGPSLSALNAEVEQILTGTGADQFGISRVSDVSCNQVASWSPGSTFECSVYAAPRRQIGVYRGTVLATTSSGAWRWTGTWYPVFRPSGSEQQA